jgi:hypothetical protein
LKTFLSGFRQLYKLSVLFLDSKSYKMFTLKVQHTLALAVAFYVFSSPMTYRIVDRVVGTFVDALVPQLRSVFRVAEGGCPTQYGLLVHTTVFALVCYFVLHA